MPHFKLMSVPGKQARKCMRCITAAAWGWHRAIWLWLALLVASCPAVLAQPSAAPDTVMLRDSLSSIDLETRGTYWIDPAGTATIEQLTRSRERPRFGRLHSSQFHALGETGSLWLHLRFQRDRDQRQEWLVELPIPLLDKVTLFQMDAMGQWQSQTAGDTVAVDAWPESGRYPFFRLDLPPGQTRDVYLRLQHTTPIHVPLRLTTETAHDLRAQVEYLGLGIAFGALLLLIAACALQAWVYDDPTYAWYSVYAASMSLAVAAYTGVGGHLIWSQSGLWADLALGFLAVIAAAAAAIFIRDLTAIHVRSRFLGSLMRVFGRGGMVLACTFFFVSKQWALALIVGYILLVAALSMSSAWMTWRRGDVVGLWVLAAFLPLAAAVGLTLIQALGWIPVSFGMQYAVVISTAIEVPLLLVALTLRSRERHGAQIRELALSTQDALTGLLAPHLFMDRLQQVVTRYRRDHEDAAVVYIDLVNYGRIKSVHGASVAEQSLLRSVIKLRRLLRDVDTVSRVSEARFGLVLEGVSSRASVTDRAARLIASGLMPLKGLKPEVTLHFHMAAVLLHERLHDAHTLVAALDGVLGSMSPRTRRPIRFLEPEDTDRVPLELPESQGPDSVHDSDDSDPPQRHSGP